jgi:23S rRNA pseudouridine1911/1915/1917 synthase
VEEIRRLTFNRGRPPERLDRFLVEGCPDLTRSQLKRLIDEGRVLIGEDPAKAGSRLRGGETITLSIPPVAPADALPEEIPLSVLYEDPHLIVIDKPAGLVVHPAPGHQGGTLVNALLHHCPDLAGVGGELRPGIVHRLDKDTSGVMVATKNDMSHNHLAQQFKQHSINRRYVALVHGTTAKDKGSVESSIGRHPVHRKKMSGTSRAGRRAVTHWRVLKRYDADRLTLVELTLETGRTHQIRVHFSEMNHPVAGDPVYGSQGLLKGMADPVLRGKLQQMKRQALHARLLGFIHPVSGEYMEFESPLPADLRDIVDYLEKKYEAGHRQ